MVDSRIITSFAISKVAKFTPRSLESSKKSLKSLHFFRGLLMRASIFTRKSFDQTLLFQNQDFGGKLFPWLESLNRPDLIPDFPEAIMPALLILSL